MKKTIGLSLLLILIMMSCTKTFLTGELPSDETSLIKLAIEEKAVMGIAAGYSSNGSSWEYAAGLGNKKAKEDFSTNMLTRIASIAKPMTAIALLQLVEAGDLDLDNPIQTYLPDFPMKPEGTITVRHLLTHSSGIATYKNTDEAENQVEYESLEEALNIFKDRDLLFAPGTKLEYSTYGYVVLGRIIERVSGQTYNTYMQEHIWDVAQMYNTGLEYANQNYGNKSELYQRKDKGRIKLAIANNLSNRYPGGGIISTLEDMMKFGNALLNNDLISETSLELMFEIPNVVNEGTPYGLGWRKYDTEPGFGSVYGHEGTQTGASTLFIFVPERDLFVVILTNTSGAMDEVYKIGSKLTEIAAD